MTVEDPASICAHLLWSCFKTHDVMTMHKEHSFENHPTISAEYVKFLATNSGYDKVEQMETLVNGIKASVDRFQLMRRRPDRLQMGRQVREEF